MANNYGVNEFEHAVKQAYTITIYIANDTTIFLPCSMIAPQRGLFLYPVPEYAFQFKYPRHVVSHAGNITTTILIFRVWWVEPIALPLEQRL